MSAENDTPETLNALSERVANRHRQAKSDQQAAHAIARVASMKALAREQRAEKDRLEQAHSVARIEAARKLAEEQKDEKRQLATLHQTELQVVAERKRAMLVEMNNASRQQSQRESEQARLEAREAREQADRELAARMAERD